MSNAAMSTETEAAVILPAPPIAAPVVEERKPPRVFSIEEYNRASYELANKIQQGRIAQGCNPANLEGGMRIEGGVYESRRIC